MHLNRTCVNDNNQDYVLVKHWPVNSYGLGSYHFSSQLDNFSLLVNHQFTKSDDDLDSGHLSSHSCNCDKTFVEHMKLDLPLGTLIWKYTDSGAF